MLIKQYLSYLSIPSVRLVLLVIIITIWLAVKFCSSIFWEGLALFDKGVATAIFLSCFPWPSPKEPYLTRYYSLGLKCLSMVARGTWRRKISLFRWFPWYRRNLELTGPQEVMVLALRTGGWGWGTPCQALHSPWPTPSQLPPQNFSPAAMENGGSCGSRDRRQTLAAWPSLTCCQAVTCLTKLQQSQQCSRGLEQMHRPLGQVRNLRNWPE